MSKDRGDNLTTYLYGKGGWKFHVTRLLSVCFIGLQYNRPANVCAKLFRHGIDL